ncbi:hypothetical protein PFICI_00378 [Pestalotiopsis fici W106-1]|uniref:C2H2-type domain-containing protein n=1 Tax=Pestalotiopsis fici (strain W106-1 / CGMCC3.15140) TaxID=1229662 RepID=W3XKM0_PESFW|nr:uncharacterized protein PFICI_00378 [Pestalotiopsis fici W106-1]ETS86550.1 hypothetical protein PFICI_00378 [Pestalotiopsis fici W106-1]
MNRDPRWYPGPDDFIEIDINGDPVRPLVSTAPLTGDQDVASLDKAKLVKQRRIEENANNKEHVVSGESAKNEARPVKQRRIEENANNKEHVASEESAKKKKHVAFEESAKDGEHEDVEESQLTDLTLDGLVLDEPDQSSLSDAALNQEQQQQPSTPVPRARASRAGIRRSKKTCTVEGCDKDGSERHMATHTMECRVAGCAKRGEPFESSRKLGEHLVKEHNQGDTEICHWPQCSNAGSRTSSNHVLHLRLHNHRLPAEVPQESNAGDTSQASHTGEDNPQKVDSQNVDSQNVDSQNVDSQNVHSQETDSQEADSNDPQVNDEDPMDTDSPDAEIVVDNDRASDSDYDQKRNESQSEDDEDMVDI